GVPEAVIGAGSQRPFAIRDFPIGVYEAGKSSTARNPQFVGGLAPWALRRDLEALRLRRGCLSQPGGASGSGGAGGSGGTGGNADGTGVRGTRPTVPELTGCTYATFIKCDPLPFIRTEGAVGLCQWFERLESVFQIRRKLWVLKLLTILLGVSGASGSGGTGGNAGGTGVRDAGPTVFELTRCTYATFTKCDPLPFNGTEGAVDKADEATEGEKRKGEGDRGSRGDNQHEHNRRQNQRRGNAGAMTNAASKNNETCQKCKNKRHA
nr:hypothetical protein [Tanacetum cinerariifolium]